MTPYLPIDEIARRQRAARMYAGLFGLCLLAFVFSSWIAWQEAKRQMLEVKTAQQRVDTAGAELEPEPAQQKPPSEVVKEQLRARRQQAAAEEEEAARRAAAEAARRALAEAEQREKTAAEPPRWQEAARQAVFEAELRAEEQRREATAARRAMDDAELRVEEQRRETEAAWRQATVWQKMAQQAKVQSSEPSEKGGWTVAMTAMVTALGTLVTGIATMSSVRLAWRAESRQVEEFQLKIRQLEHQVQELDAKKREGGSTT